MDIELKINGQPVRIKEGATVMQAATALGIYIPHFCYHPKLSIAANCRMCLVDIAKSPKPLPACATLALAGMEVQVDSPKAIEAQNSVMEFLLINHPLDCPICDQGGECQLQDLAVGYGMSKSRYTEEKRVVMEKNLGPLIATDMTRCIHCTRCVRFGREIGGMMELGMIGRGEHAEIMPFIERTVDSELSGNMIDVCPVGALTSKPFRFTARPWELTQKPSISPHDAWGSHLVVHTKDHAVKRITPGEKEDINQCWLADRDRFSYLGLTTPDRALAPFARPYSEQKFEEQNWREAVAAFARQLQRAAQQDPNQMGFFISPNATLEEQFLWQKIARGLGCENIDSRLWQRDFSAAAPAQFGFRIADLKTAGAILFIGADPARELPLLPTRLKRPSKRRSLLSIGATDIRSQMHMAAQCLVRPSDIADTLQSLNHLLGLSPNSEIMLFDEMAPALKNMATLLQNTNRRCHIVFGDVAQNAENYGNILQQAQILADGIGAQVGVICGGANGAGAHQVGCLPQKMGVNTAAMLRQGLKSVALFNCEAADFSEQSLAQDMVETADFVGTLTTHLSSIRRFADIILPIAAFAENEGTLINGEGREQTFTAAAHLPGRARPGWKVLRILGDALGLDGFAFASLAEVRAMLADCQFTPPAQTAAAIHKNTDKTDTLEIIGGAPIYGGDMLVRRAEALQKTAAGRATSAVFMHPDDMRRRALTNGDSALIKDSEQHTQAAVFADERLARGAILARLPALRETRVSVLPTQQAAAG